MATAIASNEPVANFEAHRAELQIAKRKRTILWGFIFLVLLALSVNVSQFFPEKVSNGLPKIGDYIYDTLPVLKPDLLLEDTKTEGSIAYWYFNLPKYLWLLFETINIALFATLLGAIAGLILCFPASRNLVESSLVYHSSRRVMEIARGVPEIIYAIIFVYAFGIGPAAGVLAIAIHTAGALGKMFAEVNENVSRGPIEGVRASGGNWLDEMRYGVLPQVWPNFLSYILLRLEINIRASSIIGFVGGGGVGEEMKYIISFNFYEEVSALVILIVLTVTCVDLISERLRHRAIGQEKLI